MTRRPAFVASLAAAAGGAALALAGCAVGPNHHPAPAPAIARYTPTPTPSGALGPADAPQRLVEAAEAPERWWTAFGSPELDALVARAVARNADLAASRATLRAAHQAYLVQRGGLLPSVEIAAQGSRNRSSAYLQPPLNTNAFVYTLLNAQVNVGYTFDVFGGVRRSVEQAAALEEAQRFQTRAAYLALTGQVVAAYIQLASLRSQAQATGRLIADDERLLALVGAQRRGGQVSGAELAGAQAQLAQAQAALPALAKGEAQQLDLLAVLTGEPPSGFQAASTPVEALSTPAELPVSLPADLVRRRPDLRAADAQVHAAAAAVGVALANRLPNLTLTGAYGGTSGAVGALFTPGDQLWSVVGGLTQPVFQGSALRHRQRQAEAALDQAREQYRSTLLNALQNVADVLAAVPVDASAATVAKAAQAAADRQLAIAHAQHGLGQTSEAPELAADILVLQARLARAQATAARLDDSVALYVALGGDWRPDPARRGRVAEAR